MTPEEFIDWAIIEDIGDGDHTSLSTIPANTQKKARLLVKEDGIIAGIDVAKTVFHKIDSSIKFSEIIKDGASIKKGDIAFTVEGNAQKILMAERLALNFLQRMSGIATHTNYLASLIKDYKTKVLDTRKTTPGIRYFEKLAVKIGGGENHRFGLYDMILIKDNHIDYAGSIKNAIDNTLAYLEANQLNLKIEIEARDLEEVRQILEVGKVDRIMLDNFSYEDLKTAVSLINGKYESEASGNINASTIQEYAKCGVDYVSVGALTHQIKSLDMSLKAFE